MVENKVSEKRVYTEKQINKRVLFPLSLLSIAFIFFDSNIAVNIIVILVCGFLFLKEDKTICVAIYIYLTIWERCTTLPVFSSISIIQIFLLFKLIQDAVRNSIKLSVFDLFFIVLLFFLGVRSFINTKEFAGLFLCFDAIIASFVHSFVFKESDEEKGLFWKRVFLFITVSTFFSILWGIVQRSWASANLYISNQYILRLTTTIGTDRSCMLFCAAMIYPIYHMKKGLLRLLSIVVLISSIVLTLSLTAIFCFSIFFFIFFLSSYKQARSKKKIAILCAIVVALLWFLYAWTFGSHISAIDIVITRIKNTFLYMQAKDYGKVTTNRVFLWQEYMSVFHNQSLFYKVFGPGISNPYEYYNMVQYSHNTFIDMLLYFGFLPTCICLIHIIGNIASYKKRPEFIQVVLLKTCYMFTALSVSMLSSNYWWIVVTL